MGLYSDRALDLLRAYTGRETEGTILKINENKTNKRLKINFFKNKHVNAFLGTGGREPNYMYFGMRASDLREYLEAIEDLYCMMCEYGSEHELPPTLYRAEWNSKEVIQDSNNRKMDNYIL